MNKGFRTKIYPDKFQQEKIIKFCHASRFAYNWAIGIEEENYKNGGKFISGYDLTVMFTQVKKQEGMEWLKEVSGRAVKIAILNAGKAYDNFFNKKAKHPKFKSKKNSKMKCATHERSTVIESRRIRCEKLGWITTHKHRIPVGKDIKYSNHKLEYDGIDYWFSVSCELPDDYTEKVPKTEAVGIDLGIKTLAVCSNGMTNKKPNIRKDRKKLNRLKRKASRHYSRMIDISKRTKTKFAKLKKSKNLYKLEKAIKKVYRKIEDKLTTNIHEFTTAIIKLNPTVIILEDLNVKGMMKNKHLAEKIADAKFGEIRRQFTYKCDWNNISLIIADRWYASSKTCSCCGNKKQKLSLSERQYICEECGLVIDRDYNAALNLKSLAA